MVESIQELHNNSDTLHIFVYQMGKVASNSVVDYLCSEKIDDKIHHIHFMSDQAINYLLQWQGFGEKRGDVITRHLAGLKRHVAEGRKAKELWDNLVGIS
ncbi:hypothetical protein ACFL1Z_07845 [Thermodesulfobacteriota bacterium]